MYLLPDHTNTGAKKESSALTMGAPKSDRTIVPPQIPQQSHEDSRTPRIYLDFRFGIAIVLGGSVGVLHVAGVWRGGYLVPPIVGDQTLHPSTGFQFQRLRNSRLWDAAASPPLRKLREPVLTGPSSPWGTFSSLRWLMVSTSP